MSDIKEIWKLYSNGNIDENQFMQEFDVFKANLANEMNDRDSLIEAYKALSNIVKAKPELASKVFEAFKVGLANETNDRDSLKEAYSTLSAIVKAKPELAKDIMVNIVLESRGEGDEDTFELTFLAASCMKKLNISDFPNVDDEQKAKLEMAKKLAYSTREEIRYIIESDNQRIEKLLEKGFSAQQRYMNVLMSKLGEENNLSKEETQNYRRDISNKTYDNNADWLVPASFKGADVFGCWFPNYIKMATQDLSVHDSVYWLPEDMGKDKNESFVSFVQRNLVYVDNHGEKHVRKLNEMEIIAKNWAYLKPEEEKQKFNEILAICTSRKYADQEYANFAVEASKWGVYEDRYKDYEDIYKAGLKVPEPFDSTKEFKFGNYTGKFLPREDVRVGFFGQHTNCCQHYYGAGKACAISSIKDPYSQLFVIENQKGDIVAGSWVWENKEGEYRDVCFDNIEAIGDYEEHPMINKIYEMAGRYLTEEANCRKVTIGMGYQDADTSSYEEVECVDLPSHYDDRYSDAKETQVLLAENKNAKPLDKTQESRRFVRDACFLDYDAMDEISAKCFPDSDAQLQEAGERLTGLALVDEIKGVVGYCLYDAEERYISDMAVLPEYRTDKNASSRRLLGEMVRKVREIGGEWSAELRDETSFRYMKAMQERGLVEMKTHGVDHTMDDGSEVYSVTFKVKEQKTKEKQSLKAVANYKGGKEA